MIIYANPTFYLFLAVFASFVLLLLPVFSIPLVSSFYFMHSSQANGVKFGMWGWCLDEVDLCSPLQLGYTWDPEIPNPITKSFVLYPITAIFVFLTMVSMVPVLCARKPRTGDKLVNVLAWISFALSAFALFFMLGIWGTAKRRFGDRGFSASYGNLPWMSLSGTLLLFVVALSPYFVRPPPKGASPSRSYDRSDVEVVQVSEPRGGRKGQK